MRACQGRRSSWCDEFGAGFQKLNFNSAIARRELMEPDHTALSVLERQICVEASCDEVRLVCVVRRLPLILPGRPANIARPSHKLGSEMHLDALATCRDTRFNFEGTSQFSELEIRGWPLEIA